VKSVSHPSILFLAPLLLLLNAAPSPAHFGMVIPSRTMVETEAEKDVSFELLFRHPFEGQGMNLAKPESVVLFSDGEKKDLLPALEKGERDGHAVWKGSFRAEKPGLSAVVMTPRPYWEPAEDKFIVHITKSYVAAFGEDEGWDKPLGLASEIVPLCKPYGLYAGNVFQGRVLVDGKAVPGAEVEVEFYPGPGLRGQAPGELMITQTVKADRNGVFTYAAPKAGWWGFAALSEAKRRITHEGKPKPVETGAVIWVRFYDMK
jgi:cobalt/nickel transport protein